MNTNYGFIPSIIEDEHYKLGDGNLSSEILMPQGHGWGNYLPQDEVQQRGNLETSNCTNYGTNHALATLGKMKFGLSFQTNFSERYTGVMTRTTPFGNSPHFVIEQIRNICGEIPEVFLPFTDQVKLWSDYYSPEPMSYALFKIGYHWRTKYKVGHDWVFDFVAMSSLSVRQTKMMLALQFSPLGASVYAWSLHGDGLYYDEGAPKNHWITVYDFDEGKCWYIFDSYDNTHKKLDWNFDFGQAKRYTIDRLLGAETPDLPTTENYYIPYCLYLLDNFISKFKSQ